MSQPADRLEQTPKPETIRKKKHIAQDHIHSLIREAQRESGSLEFSCRGCAWPCNVKMEVQSGLVHTTSKILSLLDFPSALEGRECGGQKDFIAIQQKAKL